MGNDAIIVGAIRACQTRAELENVFELFAVSGLKERYALLNKAMYGPRVFYSFGENTNQADRYELTLQVFLKGSWKLQEYYEKLRVGVIR